MTAQPIGHYEFCRRHVAECSVRSASKRRINLTADRWQTLVSVNDRVNREITTRTDEELFGRAEVWAYPDGAGDCEDLALEKRRALIAKGWPVGSLLMTVAQRGNGEGHAVLTVLTDRGDFILDNLDPRVRQWAATDYRFVKRQSELDSGAWMSINDVRASTVGSLAR
jgi:predicted transglutaminase-like cysteine proteinase